MAQMSGLGGLPTSGAGNGWSPVSNSARRVGSSMPKVSSGSSGSGGTSSALNYVNAMSDYIDAFNVAQTNMVNDFNAKEAQKNRDWQERMARNAHQYEVEDLIKAGLNPVLSAGGQGAFVGNGAVASGQKAVADDTRAMAAMSLLNNSISSAGKIAQAVGSRGSVQAAESAWKMTVSDGIKIAGIAASLFRTGSNALNAWYNHSKALAYGAYAAAAGAVGNKYARKYKR